MAALRNIGIITSGGDSGGLNAVIRGAAGAAALLDARRVLGAVLRSDPEKEPKIVLDKNFKKIKT